jgi:hypothetical protein
MEAAKKRYYTELGDVENIFAVKYKKMNDQTLSQERKKLKTKRSGRDTALGDEKQKIDAVESLRLSG